jgi:hypothetical protein
MPSRCAAYPKNAHLPPWRLASIRAPYSGSGSRSARSPGTLAHRPGAALPMAVKKRIVDNQDELSVLKGLPSQLFNRVDAAIVRVLDRVEPELEERSGTGQVLHGDLCAEHVYDLEEGVLILDRGSFNPSLAMGADDPTHTALRGNHRHRPVRRRRHEAGVRDTGRARLLLLPRLPPCRRGRTAKHVYHQPDVHPNAVTQVARRLFSRDRVARGLHLNRPKESICTLLQTAPL